VQPQANLLLTGFGAGLTWSAHILRWGARTTPLGQSDVELPPCNQTGLEMIREIMKVQQDGKTAR
jgi:3-oxoacyl-[acyl-carrier-protein] synthase-3